MGTQPVRRIEGPVRPGIIQPYGQDYRQWFVARQGEQFGPYTSDQMRAMIQIGEVVAMESIWCEGMSQWMAATNCFPEVRPPPPQYAPALYAPPPPPPQAVNIYVNNAPHFHNRVGGSNDWNAGWIVAAVVIVLFVIFPLMCAIRF